VKQIVFFLAIVAMLIGAYTGPSNADEVSARDLQGTWVVTWDNNNEIGITATGRNTFKGRYTNINNDNIFKGHIKGRSIIVRQFYGDGRLYGTYTFNIVSPSLLRGSLVDYAKSYGNVVWRKK